MKFLDFGGLSVQIAPNVKISSDLIELIDTETHSAQANENTF